MSRTKTTLPALAALLLAGCGGGPGLAPVSGRITLDGQPAAGVTVTFQPVIPGDREPGPASYGKTGGDGRYTLLTLDDDRRGARVCRHEVVLNLPAPGSNPDGPPKDRLPARYNRKTELSFDVPAAGTSAADFDLTSR